MLIEPTHTTDGQRLDPLVEAATPFMAWLDEPAGTEVIVAVPVLRCRGWAISRGGSPIRVSARARASGTPEVATIADDPRPDVAENLSAEFPIQDSACGFDLRVPLPDKPGSVPVVLRIEDGLHSGQLELQVHRSDGTPRADYKTTWQDVSFDFSHAAVAVAGYTDERELQRTAEYTLGQLKKTTGIKPDDVVLEIGAGVGRLGPVIAPLVGRWIATDVSSNMLGYARERCAGFPNVEFVEVNGWDLAPVPDRSVDLVYSTVVFMHLDEWDRFSYVREAHRVLREGGRIYIDNVNLRSDDGWAFFERTLSEYHPLDRPPNISKTSTAEELRSYLARAGFVDVQSSDDPVDLWTFAWAVKPTERQPPADGQRSSAGVAHKS